MYLQREWYWLVLIDVSQFSFIRHLYSCDAQKLKRWCCRAMPQGLQKDMIVPFVWKLFVKPHPKTPVLHVNSCPCPLGSVLPIPDSVGFNTSVSEEESPCFLRTLGESFARRPVMLISLFLYASSIQNQVKSVVVCPSYDISQFCSCLNLNWNNCGKMRTLS